MPESFRIALARCLRASGEWGRALSLLENQTGGLVEAEAAETARRAGDRGLARARTSNLLRHEDTAVRSRASATHARIELDEGHVERAQALIADAPVSAATCETQALVQLALGERDAARQTIMRGRALPAGDEELARLEGLIGMLEHADGDASKSALGISSGSRASGSFGSGPRRSDLSHRSAMPASIAARSEKPSQLRALSHFSRCSIARQKPRAPRSIWLWLTRNRPRRRDAHRLRFRDCSGAPGA